MAAKPKKDPLAGFADIGTAETVADAHAGLEGDYMRPEEYHVVRAEQVWGYDDTGHQLTVDQALFCRSYIIDRNPVAALRRLNMTGEPSALKKMAEKYLTNVEVQGCVEVLAKRMMERLEITADKINRRIAAVAFFDPRSIMSFDHKSVTVLHSRFWSEDQAYAIQSVEMGKEGIKLKLYDGMRAAELLGKQIGSLKDDSVEAAAAASRIAADAVMDRILDIFDKVVPDDNLPPTLQIEAKPGGETVQ